MTDNRQNGRPPRWAWFGLVVFLAIAVLQLFLVIANAAGR